jgi:hypothetical protein
MVLDEHYPKPTVLHEGDNASGHRVADLGISGASPHSVRLAQLSRQWRTLHQTRVVQRTLVHDAYV